MYKSSAVKAAMKKMPLKGGSRGKGRGAGTPRALSAREIAAFRGMLKGRKGMPSRMGNLMGRLK